MPICPSFMFGRELCLRFRPTINPDVIMIFYQNVDMLHRAPPCSTVLQCVMSERSVVIAGVDGVECRWSISRLMRTPWLIFSGYFSQWSASLVLPDSLPCKVLSSHFPTSGKLRKMRPPQHTELSSSWSAGLLRSYWRQNSQIYILSLSH